MVSICSSAPAEREIFRGILEFLQLSFPCSSLPGRWYYLLFSIFQPLELLNHCSFIKVDDSEFNFLVNIQGNFIQGNFIGLLIIMKPYFNHI